MLTSTEKKGGVCGGERVSRMEEIYWARYEETWSLVYYAPAPFIELGDYRQPMSHQASFTQ